MAKRQAKPKKPPKPKPPVDHRLSYNFVPGIGPTPARVMLVGEGPGQREDRYREPFVGPSGQLLTDILERQHIFRSDLYITNVIKRRIVDDKDPTPEEVELFRPYLEAELEKVQPEIVIAAGGFASRFFLGQDTSLELVHGMPTISTDYGVAVVPCFHPASGLHDTDSMAAVYWDYQKAAAFIEGRIGYHKPRRAQTLIVPSSELPDHPPDCFGIDTEDLVDGRPWCATVSWFDGGAAFIAADDHVALHKIEQWMLAGTVCYIHASLHDLKPLRLMGRDWAKYLHWGHHRSRMVDTMVLAFEQGGIHTQALKTLSYRLLDTLMTSYQEVVSPVEQRRALDYLLQAYSHDGWSLPEEQAVWDEKAGKVKIGKPWSIEKRLTKILEDRSADSSTDLVKRWEAIGDEQREEVQSVMGAFPRTDLSHCHRPTAIDYACTDASQTRRLGLELDARHRILELHPIAAIDHGQIPMVERMVSNGLPADKEYFLELGRRMKVMQKQLADLLSTLVGRPVNPNSSDQVADLLYKEMGLEPAKLTPGGKASTSKKALEHLRDGNPLVEFIMASREYGKIDDAFCQNIANRTVLGYEHQEVGLPWTPILEDTLLAAIMEQQDEAGLSERAFFELMVTRAKTGRLAAKNFNALAIPTRTDLGRQIRYGFKAKEGRLLGTWDLNQIEMRVMAHLSDDPLMVEIYNRSAKQFPKHERDLHIMTAARVYGCDPRDVKKIWRTACKSTGFGIIMGITGKGLADQMRLYGLDPAEWTEERCDELIREWLKVYQGVNDYQLIKRAEARRNGEVRDMFGRRFLLPHANCPLSWIRGEAERQSHALDVQSSAQCIEKIAMAKIDREVLPRMRELGYCEPVLQVHDELILEFDEDLEPVLDAEMLRALTTAVVMRVPVEAGSAIGPSWGDLEK
jgi:uracil-DNA glycosylase family 4